MPDFSFVTYSELPELDPDDRLAIDLLASRGLHVAPAVWDDPDVDWSRAGIVIIRSTWDYHRRQEQFLTWADSVASVARIYNSPALVRWNSHKSYLRDLEQRGVPVVPTAWLTAGAHADLCGLMEKQRWPRAVVKPAVGLATYGVRIVAAGDDGAGQAHVDSLLREHDVLVQPYIQSVQDYGERALVFFNGAYSHATRKTAFQALLTTGKAGETASEATEAEIAAAARAIEALPEPALYARVDIVLSDAGDPLVIELELVEPTLFLGMHPAAAGRFADALAALAAGLAL